MASTVSGIVVDCADPQHLGRWWGEVLGWEIDPDDDGVELIDSERDFNIYFQPVPEPKTVKDRIHIDLRPDDQAAEVERLIGMGATKVDVGQGDVTWVVLADPEGNEFCVLRAKAA